MVQLSPQQCAALLSCLRLTVFGVALADVLRDPKYEPDDQDLDVAEIFTTAQTLVLAALALKLQAEPYDVLQGRESACTLAGRLPGHEAKGWWTVVRGSGLLFLWLWTICVELPSCTGCAGRYHMTLCQEGQPHGKCSQVPVSLSSAEVCRGLLFQCPMLRL
jgi:hypothetical protein